MTIDYCVQRMYAPDTGEEGNGGGAGLSQNEIDAIVNPLPDDSASGGKPGKKFSHKENKNQRFRFEYHSPIVRKSQCVFNPDPRAPPPAGKVVVRTLDNYRQYLSAQRTAQK